MTTWERLRDAAASAMERGAAALRLVGTELDRARYERELDGWRRLAQSIAPGALDAINAAERRQWTAEAEADRLRGEVARLTAEIEGKVGR